MKAYALPPGPRSTPLVGNSVAYRKDRLGYLTNLSANYGPIATMHLGRTPVVLITQPSALREVLIQQPTRFQNRDVMLNMSLLLGESTLRRHLFTPRRFIERCCGCAQERSLLASDGELHDRQREAMTEAFHGPALEKYLDIMVALTERMVDGWGRSAEIELTGEMQRLTASIVFQTLFGIDVHDRSDAIIAAYRKMLRHSGSPFRPFLPLADKEKDNAWLELMGLVDRILENAAARKADHNSSLLIDLMLRGEAPENGGQTVRDQVGFFMAAGHLTVSGLLVWALSLLAKHPDVLERLRSELHITLGGSTLRIQDLPRLSYLDWVVKETLRLYPAVWLHGRRAVGDCEIDGWPLPKGTFVLFSQWVTQRSEKYFSDPLRFMPERFAPDRTQLHTPSAYFPFGLGPRSCLGSGFAMLEAKIVLSIVLQSFVPILITEDDQLEPTPHYVLLQPRGEVRMRMESLAPIGTLAAKSECRIPSSF